MSSKKRLDVDKAVHECKLVANKYLREWKPYHTDWKTIEGCAYLRLSTDDQVLVEKGSLEQQVYMAIHEAELRSRQKRRNYKITHFFIEPGVSGRRSDRREFIELKKAIRRREFAFVAFKEISRVARDSQIWKEFFRLCHDNACEIVIRGLPIDPNDPTQILQLDILAVFAEYEAQLTAKRIRESVFSAMLSSGKFNSTHKTLGLDPLIVEGQRKVGFYQVNDEEMLIVNWIMETFVEYGSHQKTLDAIRKRGIKNWNGTYFHRHSLNNLLSNPKYIGKWFLNEGNKEADQDELPDQKRYYEIDLPHGPVVSVELWNRVQDTLKNVVGNLGKNTRVSRVYPLSGGVLTYYDGSTFRGCSGTGKTKRSHYYFNETNRLRIKCEIIEEDVKKIVSKIIQNSPVLQDAIREAGEETNDQVQFLNQRIKDIQSSLNRIELQKASLIQKLGLLTSNSSEEDVHLFKNEFKEMLQVCSKEKLELEGYLRKAKQDLAELETTAFSWKDIPKHASRVQDLMLEKDPVALKRAYRGLFHKIIIGAEDSLGQRQVIYVLKNEDELPTDFTADGVRLNSKVVDPPGRVSNCLLANVSLKPIEKTEFYPGGVSNQTSLAELSLTRNSESCGKNGEKHGQAHDRFGKMGKAVV